MAERPELAAAVSDGVRADADLEGSVLIGFVIVAEAMSPDGTRWLTRMVGDGTGDPDRVTTWQIDGYLQAATSTAWPRPSLDAQGDDEE